MSDAPEIRYFFIRRPIFSAVVAIVIVLLGLFALVTLPLNRYPQITPPVVQVTATYPGATAEDVAQAVAAPIEQQLSGLAGLLYFKSSNSSDGTMNLSVYFDISRNVDLAAVDVQNQVALARAAAAAGGRPARDHGQEGADGHPAGGGAPVGRPALHGRPTSATTRRSTWRTSSSGSRAWATRQHLRPARVLDAAEPGPRPDGTARAHGRGRRRGGAGAEHDQSRGPDRAGARAAGYPAHDPGDDRRPAQDPGRVREHHRAGAPGRVAGAGERHRTRDPRGPQLRPRRAGQRQADREHPGLSCGRARTRWT